MSTEVSADFTGILDGRPAPDRYEPSEEDKRTVTNLQERWAAAARWRLPWERGWELCRSYLEGDQLLGRHKITGEVIRLSAEDSKKLKSQNNALRPIARSLNGKLNKLIPAFRVIPGSADFDEQNGVKTAEQLANWMRQKEDLDLLYQSMNSYLSWSGNSFFEVCWDPNEGRKVAFCGTCQYWTYQTDYVAQPCPQCQMQREQEAMLHQMQQEQLAQETLADVAMQDPSVMEAGTPDEIMQGMEPPEIPMQQMGPLPLGAPIPPMEEAREGDTKFRLRDIFDVFLPPGCTNILRAQWYCVREIVPLSEAATRYPFFAPFIKPDTSSYLTEAGKRTSGPYYVASNSYEDLAEHVEVRQYHERPTELYPNGRMLTTLGDMLVEEREEPAFLVGSKRFGLFQFGFDVCENRLYFDSFINHAWHRQRELNILETQLREGVTLGLRKKVLVPLMSRIAVDELTSESSQIIPYNNAAGDPHELATSDIPQGAWTRKADIMADLRSLASVTESEQGIMGTDPNGRAAAIINAEADQQIGPIVRRNNTEWREGIRLGLLFYRFFAHPDRIATTVGGQTVSFANLNLLSDGWDIVLHEEDSLSRNPAVRYQQVLELWQATAGQYFLDPLTGMIDWKKFNRMACLADTDTGYDTEAMSKATASAIPDLLKQGIPWEPKNYDVPHFFAEELAAWLRDRGRKEDPAIAMQVEQIWTFYEMAKINGMVAMMSLMGQGPDGGTGTGSAPGSTMSAPGGTPTGLGSAMGPSSISAEASGQVAQADQMGEMAAQSY